MRHLCVYCGSGPGRNPAYMAAARALGTHMANQGIGLVYGGGSLGLMGEVARSVIAAGGHVVGIIPEFLVSKERMLTDVNELIVTASMHERKMTMFERSDGFVALPGGLGTLEEIFEVWSWRQLGFHAKPVGFLNAGGFWTPLLGALRAIADSGFLPASTLDDLAVAPDLPTLLEALQERLRKIPQPAHGDSLR